MSEISDLQRRNERQQALINDLLNRLDAHLNQIEALSRELDREMHWAGDGQR